MLALLHGSDCDMQQAAAFLAYSLATESQELRSAMVDAGGPTALLSCLRQHTGPGARQLQYCSGYCALALGALCSCNPEVQRAVAAAGGAAVLVPLLGSSNAVAQLGAAKALQWLAEGCPEGQQVAEAAGAVPALSQLLASNANESARNAAMQALLTLWSAQVQQEANGIPALVHVLQHSQNGAEQRAAFSILYTMHTQCGLPERQAMAAAGAVPALQRFLTVCRQDEAAAGFVQPASTLLDLLNSLPARCAAGYACMHLGIVGFRICSAAAYLQWFTQLNTLPQLKDSSSLSCSPEADERATIIRRPRVCAAPGCGATRGLKRCGGCGTVRYCSEACSRVHWREHKAGCRRLQGERAAAAREQQ